MWPDKFEDRLRSWHDLRQFVQSIPLRDQLNAIAKWWGHCPRISHAIHWNDQSNWPDPWDLLADNSFDDLAIALGMSYTITMLEDLDSSVEIALATDDQAQEYNLVMVDDRKYILNYEPWEAVSTERFEFNITKTIDARTIRIE